MLEIIGNRTCLSSSNTRCFRALMLLWLFNSRLNMLHGTAFYLSSRLGLLRLALRGAGTDLASDALN